LDEAQKKYIQDGCKEDKQEKKCEECQKLGKMCARPTKLYKGVFPPEMLTKYFTPEEAEELLK